MVLDQEFFIKRYEESGCGEAELLDLISEMDSSLAGADEDMSLEKKCEIIERAIADAHYTSWTLDLIGLVISFPLASFRLRWRSAIQFQPRFS